MGEKLVIGPVSGGLQKNVTAFNVDNNSFPVLINAYQWRGRVKRKRGTEFLARLTRFFDSTSTAYSSTSTILLVGTSANLLTGFSLETNGNIIPGSVEITDITSGNVFTDPAEDGVLVGAPGGAGTINYATGDIVISSGGANGDSLSAQFLYYPDLPVMGLKEFNDYTAQFPLNISFDTKYSYNISTANPYPVHSVSFYKNPAASADLPNYVAKTTSTPVSWNGQDYQQFWTVNYEGALWATNGVSNPFVTTNIGMQFKEITGVAIVNTGPPTPGPRAEADLTIVAHGLVRGDFVYINEVVGITGINFQTGYVISADPQAANTVRVQFPEATLGGAYSSGGIAQYLTNRSDATKDCIRFYDGDPTNGSSTAPTLTGIHGWVNFMPPISQSNFSIANLPPAQYYLVGAKMIVPFKDRLLFFGPVVQSSSGTPKYLQDTVVYSQNGTPYYTASYTNDPNPAIDTPTTATTVFDGLLLPDNQTATSPAFFSDSTGFGGFISAGLDQKLNTTSLNEDVIICGFTTTQARLVYTGNDIVPFVFYIINSELGSESTFSAINMDEGVITRGTRGFVITNQTRTDRIDLLVPDESFSVRLPDNGSERLCAQRDYDNEWMYFTYPLDEISWKFPNQTLQFNYRDQTWAIFKECYTTYGNFRKQTGFIWSTVGLTFPTWSQWNQPWNASTSNLLQSTVIGGNQQGFVLIRNQGTAEGNSLYIRSFSTNTLTVPDHCLNVGDFITISGALGTVGAQVNGKVFSVGTTPTKDTLTLFPNITSATYSGGGLIKRMYIPLIQTRQFPVAWSMGRKTRIGPQQYLFTTTNKSQITLYIFLSQNADSPYNQGVVVPDISENNSLIYSSVLYTCTESVNLGLTPANSSLMMISEINNAETNASSPQGQIWHRVNTSLIGDTVQLGFTMSDSQMRDPDFTNQFAEIEFHGAILDLSPSSMLS